MDIAQIIKQEPDTSKSEVVDIKHQPIEPDPLKIINVFTISVVPGTKFTEGLNSMSRKPIVAKYDGRLYQSNFSCPSRTRKQILPAKRKNVFECDFCSTVLFSAKSLEKHVADMHSIDKEFKCMECQSFNSRDELDYHILIHSAIKSIKCQFCPNTYRSNADLRIHEMNNHGKDKKYKCSKCSKSYARNYLLKVHLKAHSNASNKKKEGSQSDPICSTKFTLQNQVKEENMRSMTTHEVAKTFKCKLCSGTYLRNMDLQRHNMQAHGKEKEFKCPICPKSYTRKYVLQNHVRTHLNEKTTFSEDSSENFTSNESLNQTRPLHKMTSSPAKRQANRRPIRNTKSKTEPIEKQDTILTCDICSTVFFSVESLEEHVVEMHVVDKEFKCTECPKSFINPDKLDSHMVEHEHEEEAQIVHKCPVCSRTFARKKLVTRHLSTHDGLKPFKCNLCPNTFARRYDLQRHELQVHVKEKNFKCPRCPKSFARAYALEGHIRTHFKAKTILCRNSNAQCKKHKCSVCDKAYEKMSQLKEHMTRHSDKRQFKCNLCSVTYKQSSSLYSHLRIKHNITESF